MASLFAPRQAKMAPSKGLLLQTDGVPCAADHPSTQPSLKAPLIIPLERPLVGKEQSIDIVSKLKLGTKFVGGHCALLLGSTKKK